MRSAMFATLCLGLFAACDHATQSTVSPVTVQWMEWPAEVNAGQPFRTRLVVWGVCSLSPPRFYAGMSADQSAVTFEPYYLVSKDNIECLMDRASLSTSPTLLAGALDTAGTAPGLATSTYEMRAAAFVYTFAAPTSLPVRTFGDVIVRTGGADRSRRRAAGTSICSATHQATLASAGRALIRTLRSCSRTRPTAGLSSAFVRGYIRRGGAGVRPDTRLPPRVPQLGHASPQLQLAPLASSRP
jgi:hypothetical protein